MKELPQLINVKSVQQLIAILAFALPVILVGAQWFSGAEPKFYPTISQYVHGQFGNVFVGTVAALGVLFFAYKGYDNNSGPIPLTDNQLANITAVLLILVALCNTALCGHPPKGSFTALLASIHLVSAVLSFAALGLFCLFYFTQESEHDDSPLTGLRVKIYKACGYTIFGCIVLAGITLFTTYETCPTHIGTAYVMWLESIMVWSFGLAWMVKGRLILA